MSDIHANYEKRLSALEQEIKSIKWGLGLVNGDVLETEKRCKANAQQTANGDMKLAAAEIALLAVADVLLMEASEETRQKVAESLKRRYQHYKGWTAPFLERYHAVSQELVPGITLS